MERIDTVVVGAGVVGLACARALALAGREVIVLESESAIGTATSSRNSEVIHAGIYYPPGSLKARLCVAGKNALYPFLEERGLPHRRCGKLVVAAETSQIPYLEKLRAQAQASSGSSARACAASRKRRSFTPLASACARSFSSAPACAASAATISLPQRRCGTPRSAR